jgi:hypothetical protein
MLVRWNEIPYNIMRYVAAAAAATVTAIIRKKRIKNAEPF